MGKSGGRYIRICGPHKVGVDYNTQNNSTDVISLDFSTLTFGKLTKPVYEELLFQGTTNTGN